MAETPTGFSLPGKLSVSVSERYGKSSNVNKEFIFLNLPNGFKSGKIKKIYLKLLSLVSWCDRCVRAGKIRNEKYPKSLFSGNKCPGKYTTFTVFRNVLFHGTLYLLVV